MIYSIIQEVLPNNPFSITIAQYKLSIGKLSLFLSTFFDKGGTVITMNPVPDTLSVIRHRKDKTSESAHLNSAPTASPSVDGARDFSHEDSHRRG